MPPARLLATPLVFALSLPLALAGCTGTPDEPTGPYTPALPRLVPAPVYMEAGEGCYTLDATSQIGAAAGAETVAEQLAADLRPGTGLALPVGATGDVQLALDPSLGAEAYTLDVTPDGATLTGGDEAGLFYAAQTFRQLLPPAAYGATSSDGPWTLPSLTLDDAPRFPQRGVMIDVARHFFTVADIERQVDLAALHKLNRLHLHLTDDQGWRIEITSWPDLTRIGGATEVGSSAGGYYTQADYAAIVAYAAARHMTVVPEIDLPGHAHAALASYAELNESGIAEAPYTGAGVISTPLWIDGPATAGFVEDVWRELAALTPGPELHVGGDEAVDIDDATYTGFLHDLQSIVTAEGKTLTGWDEIGIAELDPPFSAQYWWSETNAIDAVDAGATLIVSPAEHTYLDMVHDSRAAYGQTWAGAVNVERAYDWDPVLYGVDEATVAGVEGALWTEMIDDTAKMDFMVWPRLAALAEVAWTPEEGRDWEDFRDRLAHHGARLDALEVGYYRSPEIDWE